MEPSTPRREVVPTSLLLFLRGAYKPGRVDSHSVGKPLTRLVNDRDCPSLAAHAG